MSVATPNSVRTTDARTILLIDDDLSTIEIFDQILKANGYRVRVASDVESGLLELRQSAPSAVLVDLHMPKADGVEFLQQLRAGVSAARVPVAIVTGDYFVADDVAHEIRVLGARIHFKPLWEDDLLKLVDDLLDARHRSPV